MVTTNKREAMQHADLLADEWARPVAVVKEWDRGTIWYFVRDDFDTRFDTVVHLAQPAEVTR